MPGAYLRHLGELPFGFLSHLFELPRRHRLVRLILQAFDVATLAVVAHHAIEQRHGAVRVGAYEVGELLGLQWLVGHPVEAGLRRPTANGWYQRHLRAVTQPLI